MSLGAASFLNSMKNSVISKALTGDVNSLTTTYRPENGGSYIIHDNNKDVDYYFNRSDNNPNNKQGWNVERVDSQGNSSTTNFWSNLNPQFGDMVVGMDQVGSWQDGGKSDKSFEHISSLKINPGGVRDENGSIGTCKFGNGIELDILKVKGESKYQMIVPGHPEAGAMMTCEVVNGEIVLTNRKGEKNVVQLAESSSLLGSGGDGNYKFIDTDGQGFQMMS